MRTPVLAANWKMHKSASQAIAFVEALLPKLRGLEELGVEVVITPPFTALDRLASALGGSGVQLGAQNVHSEPEGPYTGEISAQMLKEFGCRYAIVGHSERRALFGETNSQVAAKAAALQRAGIRPILCVGESLEEREAGRTLEVVGRDLRESLAGVEAAAGEAFVVAYEPVWAIGTGHSATPEIAQEVHAFIREQLREKYDKIAASIRLQYGGSVKPDNVTELMAQSDIDGALVGGASLDAESFARIVRFREQEKQ